MPKLSVLEWEAVEMPLTRPELLAEVEGAARGQSPGLDGLPYEFYVVVIPLIGDHLVEALNADPPPTGAEIAARRAEVGPPK